MKEHYFKSQVRLLHEVVIDNPSLNDEVHCYDSSITIEKNIVDFYETLKGYCLRLFLKMFAVHK